MRSNLNNLLAAKNVLGSGKPERRTGLPPQATDRAGVTRSHQNQRLNTHVDWFYVKRVRLAFLAREESERLVLCVRTTI